MTKEKEPDIPDPSPLLLAQGIQCQRLGEASWDRIRYVEAEKKLKRSGMFQPLLMNSIFEKKNVPVDYSLRQQERILGTVCYGLLAQRKAFKDSLANLANLKVFETCPEAKKTIKDCFFSENSEFHSLSESLLQFVCGKRAEVIAERRKAVIPPDDQRTLRSIPPSSSHLFNEDDLRTKWTPTPIPTVQRARPTFPRKRQMAPTTSLPSKRPMMSSIQESFRSNRGSNSRSTVRTKGDGPKRAAPKQPTNRTGIFTKSKNRH